MERRGQTGDKGQEDGFQWLLENRLKYRSANNRAKKVVARAMKKEAEDDVLGMERSVHKVFKFTKRMKRDGKDVDGGRCLRDDDGRLCFTENQRGAVWKRHMEKIMNVENEWDGVTNDANKVEGPVDQVNRDEVMNAIKSLKAGKSSGPTEVCAEMIVASGTKGVDVMLELAQSVIDGNGIPDDWKCSVMVPIFKGKGDTMSCGSYRGVKLLEHAMKVVERILEKRLRSIAGVDEMQCGFMPGKGTTDALFTVRRLQEEYRAKNKKLFMCFVDLEKAFDRVPRRVIWWALRRRGVPEQLVDAVRSLYEGASTKVRVGSEFSEVFSVRVGVHQGSVLSPLLFALVLEVVTENVRTGLPYEILYADDLVLMSDSMEDLGRRFKRWKDAFESKGLKVNMQKTKVLVSGSEGEMIKSKIDPCGICGKRVMANSVKCTKCGHWIHGRCAKVTRITDGLAARFVCSMCEGKASLTLPDSAVEKMCDEVETVKAFCYLGDRINASGGCELAVTARVRFGWAKFREVGEILHGRKFSFRTKGLVYKTCVRSAMLYGSETWCLRQQELLILTRAERAMMRAMVGSHLVDKMKNKDIMDLLGVEESVAQLAKANSLRWLGHVLRRDDDSGLVRAFNFVVDGPKKTGTSGKNMEGAGFGGGAWCRFAPGRGQQQNEVEMRCAYCVKVI